MADGWSPSRRTSAWRWSACCSAFVALGAVGCRTVPAPVDDAALRTRVRLLRIDDTGRDEPAFLDSVIVGSAGPDDRGRAALTAGRLGGRGHVVAIRSLAAGGRAADAADALFALGLLKDTASISLAARQLRTADGDLASEAAWLLGEVGEPARVAITEALRDPALAPSARGALLLAATRLKPVPAAAITPWVAATDGGVAWRAAYALARGRSAGGVRTLLAATASPFAAVREQAARGLSRGLAGDSLRDAAVAALSRLVGDPAPHVRINALRALATYGAPSAARVTGALADADAAVRLTAASALDGVLDSTSNAWANALAADTAFVVQRAVVEGARRHGVSLAPMSTWRTSTEWQRRAAAAELDAIGPAAAAVARVATWLHDDDARVRAAAAAALAMLVDSASGRSSARAVLRGALRDPDGGVRASALQGLAKSAAAGDLAAALDAYALARGDRDNDARLAFWALADSVLARDSSVAPDVLSRLTSIARPADPLERLVAAHIPHFASWRDATSPARPDSWYFDRAREAGAATLPVARIETDRGVIELQLDAHRAPLTTHNFVALAQRGYFDGQRFHRVVPNFVVQGGDPRGDGSGGPGYAVRDELNPLRYGRGTVGMALSGPNTGGSQFFVTHSPQPHLDGGYTVFGQLVAGGDVLDHIVQGDRIVRITIR